MPSHPEGPLLGSWKHRPNHGCLMSRRQARTGARMGLLASVECCDQSHEAGTCGLTCPLSVRLHRAPRRHQVIRSPVVTETNSNKSRIFCLVAAGVRLDALNEALRAGCASEGQASCQRPSVGPVSGSRRGAVRARGEGKGFAGGFGYALTGAAHQGISCTHSLVARSM